MAALGSSEAMPRVPRSTVLPYAPPAYFRVLVTRCLPANRSGTRVFFIFVPLRALRRRGFRWAGNQDYIRDLRNYDNEIMNARARYRGDSSFGNLYDFRNAQRDKARVERWWRRHHPELFRVGACRIDTAQ